MELLVPKGVYLDRLEAFQMKIKKRVLSLPSNTADIAVCLLFGILPVEAATHKKILMLFNNVGNQNDDSIEKRLARRQYSIKTVKSNSWFIDLKRVL